MFESVRKHQRLLQLFLLILIFPAFAFFGIQGYDQFFGAGDDVARVGESKITRQEYEQARQVQLDQLRQQLGPQFDRSLADAPALRAQVLEQLITQRALFDEALRQRVVISDEALRSEILSMPGLLREDGSFDMDRYRSLLQAQGRSEAMFEAELRRDLMGQSLPRAVGGAAPVPDAVVEQIARLGEQKRELKRRLFDPKDYAAAVDTSDAALKRYYDEHAAQFLAPEQAKVEYVLLDAAAVEGSVQLNPDEVRAYYEQNRARYLTPEQRRASHILIELPANATAEARAAARDKAQALYKQLQGGADFAELAKAESQDPGSAPSGGDLGLFTTTMMTKPFADAAFALKEGEISEPVESEFGYHIIKLTEIRPGSQRSFDSVRSEIEAEIRKQQSARRFAEAADSFSNLVYEQPDSLEPAASRFGLKVQTADAVLRSGLPGAARDHPLNNPRLLAEVFSAEAIASHRNTQAVELGGGALAAARVIEHHPERKQPFDEVRDIARERLVEQQSQASARKAGEDLLKSLRNGGNATEAGFGELQSVTRTAGDYLPAVAVDPVFRVNADKLPGYAGADLGALGYAVYEVSKVIDLTPEELAQRKPEYRSQLEQVYAQVSLESYLDAVKARSKITRNPAALQGTPNQP